MGVYSWLRSEVEIQNWQEKRTATLKISEEAFFNNANIIISQQEGIKNIITKSVNTEIMISPITRTQNKKKYSGIDISDFNISLRDKLSLSNKLLFEVYNEEGIFYTSNSTKGFDFGMFDCKYNLIRLWNQCYGKRGLYDGDELFKCKLVENDFMLKVYDEEYFSQFHQGIDIQNNKKEITILGEIQFGNWGLIYRDLFKLLDADTRAGVDLFIYITAHNDLLSLASNNIVSYESTLKILSEFSNIIKTPVWVIGLDLEL